LKNYCSQIKKYEKYYKNKKILNYMKEIKELFDGYPLDLDKFVQSYL